MREFTGAENIQGQARRTTEDGRARGSNGAVAFGDDARVVDLEDT